MLYTVQTKQVTFAKQGYNVLAVAYAKLDDEAEIPEKTASFNDGPSLGTEEVDAILNRTASSNDLKSSPVFFFTLSSL